MFPFDPPPLKASENQRFQGDQKGTLGRKRLKYDHNFSQNVAEIQKNFMLSPCFNKIWESRIHGIYA